MNLARTAFLMVVLLATLTLGCGSDKDKGINSNRDKPRSAETPR